MTAGEVLARWMATASSEAGQAGLAAPKPEVPPQILRDVARSLRPGLQALEELTEAGDPAA